MRTYRIALALACAALAVPATADAAASHHHHVADRVERRHHTHHHHQRRHYRHHRRRRTSPTVEVAAAPTPASSPTATLATPATIEVGDVPGCLYGQDPGAYLARWDATVLRVVINPIFGAAGQAVPCVQAAVAEGYRVHLVVQWWDVQNGLRWTPSRVLAFFEQALPQYAPYLWAVSIGNEQELGQDPDCANCAGTAATAGEYAADWQAVEPFVRQECPEATVVAGEVSPWGTQFLEQTLADGLPGAQAIAAHPYHMAYGAPPAAFLAIGQAAGLPVWFDESLAGPGDSMPGATLPLTALAGAAVAGGWD